MEDAIRKSTMVDMWKLLVNAGACKTNGEARRAIEGNSVKIFVDGEWVIPNMFSLQDGQALRFSTLGELEDKVMRVGKRFFFTPIFHVN